MSLPPAEGREKLHTRTIRIEGFARPDGNFDIDAYLTDIKSVPIKTDRRQLAPGEVLHGLGARMTVTPTLQIVDFIAVMDDTPSAACETAPPNFKALIGLQIGAGFVRAAYERVGGTLGCTHIREMLQQMATVAFQTSFQVRQQARLREAVNGMLKPALLNSCHGWRAGGEMVRHLYPAYYQPAGAVTVEEGG